MLRLALKATNFSSWRKSSVNIAKNHIATSNFGARDDERHRPAAQQRHITTSTPSAVLSNMIYADHGLAASQYKIGQCYELGHHVNQDANEAVRYFLMAAAQGHAESQYQVGEAFNAGVGIAQNPSKAAEFYRLAASQGHAGAMLRLSVYYQQGNGVEENITASVTYLQLAADHGDPMAQYVLACSDEANGEEDEAAHYYKLAADQGHRLAQFHTGLCFATGMGVAVCLGEARRYFSLAASQGMAAALACAEFVREGGAVGLQEAAGATVLRASKGHVESQYKLAVLHTHGFGVRQSATEAVKLFKRAADQGNTEAQVALAVCYYLGNGVPQDDAKAEHYNGLAAMQGRVVSEQDFEDGSL